MSSELEKFMLQCIVCIILLLLPCEIHYMRAGFFKENYVILKRGMEGGVLLQNLRVGAKGSFRLEESM